MKKKTNFFKSLRFRILIILILLGSVPSVIVTHLVIANYEEKAVQIRMDSVRRQCDMLCSLLIRENYLNDSSSQVVNSKLESLCNTYGGRVLVVDRDFKIVKDTYSADQGKTLVSPQIIQCFKGENIRRYNSKEKMAVISVPVKSPEVQQLQGAMLVSISTQEIADTIDGLRQTGVLITGIIVALAIFLGICAVYRAGETFCSSDKSH